MRVHPDPLGRRHSERSEESLSLRTLVTARFCRSSLQIARAQGGLVLAYPFEYAPESSAKINAWLPTKFLHSLAVIGPIENDVALAHLIRLLDRCRARRNFLHRLCSFAK